MAETMKARIAQGEAALLHTYNRYPVVLERGDGMYLYDTEGKRYLDFFAGIAVFALGHHYPGYDEALKDQIDKLIHTSNYYYNEPAIYAAQKLTALSGMERVFFTNSGAEAVEGALKAARKYAFLKDGTHDHEIIAFEQSFHGRTFGALSVTGTKAYREPFEPLIGGVRFAKMNDINSVTELVNDKTCAIILETVQGEGGVIPAEDGFLRELRRLCDERDILLIFDEIQCGLGRTGAWFAWQHAGVKPDIMTLAKALGCGVPVGAFLVRDAFAHALAPGDHGTTYGGNPLATRAAGCVLDLFERDHIIEHVQKTAPYLEQKLDMLVARHGEIALRRGKGYMQGLVFNGNVKQILERALGKGLILINAGANIIRFVPPLVAETDHIDEMADILESCI